MDLFPSIEPFNSFHLAVSDIHTLYVEECGNRYGKPAIFLHGGPGGGLNPTYRRYFHPDKWRLVLFDQRGCGRSSPTADLRENTTWDLIADIEAIRARLGIDKWLVFGGSWGAVLALAYAEKHPERVTGLILRGALTWTRKELEWFFRAGTNYIFPEAHELFRSFIPVEAQHDLLGAYYERLTSEDPVVRSAAAQAWRRWELSAVKLQPDLPSAELLSDRAAVEASARISCHYAINGGFFECDGQIMRDIGRIEEIPGVIVHGRYDMVCPLAWALALSRRWRGAVLDVVPSAGHSASEPEIQSKLVEYTEKFRNL